MAGRARVAPAPAPRRPASVVAHGRSRDPRSGGPRSRGVFSFWRQYAAISPFYLVFIGFNLIPVLFTLYLAFQRWDGIGDEMHYVGLAQFKFLIHDPVFWLSVKNTIIIWLLATFPMLFMSLVIATMLNSSIRFVTFYRVAYFLPNVTSLVAIAIFFFAIFSSQTGIVNAALHAIGGPEIPWLKNPWTIKIVIAMLMSWQWTGYNAIIYLAGLQAIPTQLYEAAKIDGAGPVQIFFRITIPMLRPIILFTLIVSTVTGLQSFTEPQVLFGSTASINPNSGGPGQAGMTMMLYFYHQAFDNNDYGYGAAIVWALFLLILMFVLINWRLVSRSERATVRRYQKGRK